MATLITTGVGVVFLVVCWLAYRRFSAKDDEVRRGRLKRRAQGMRETSGGAAKPAEPGAAKEPAPQAVKAPGPQAGAGGSSGDS